jgi:hypothetical protein
VISPTLFQAEEKNDDDDPTIDADVSDVGDVSLTTFSVDATFSGSTIGLASSSFGDDLLLVAKI